MAGAGGFLIDASAVGRMMRPDVIEAWREPVAAGQVGICEVTTLELLRSARSAAEFARIRDGLFALYTPWPTPEQVFRRALEHQQRLAEQGALAGAGAAGLVLAATAAHHGLTLLHYDPDLDALAGCVGLPARWLAQPGTIP